MAHRLTVIGLGVLLAGWMLWTSVLDPKLAPAKTAEAFWSAVAAGDQATVESLLAPDATRTAAQWIAETQGWRFQNVFALHEAPPNPCGVEWVALVLLRTDEGSPTTRISSLKKVDGTWRILTPEGRLCGKNIE
jgi:hypothetical protein